MNTYKFLLALSVLSLSTFAMYVDPEVSYVQIVEDKEDLFEFEQQLLILETIKNTDVQITSRDKDLEEKITALYAKINKLLQKDIEYMSSEINRLEKYIKQQQKNKEEWHETSTKWHRRDVNQAFKEAFIKGSVIGVCCSFLAIVSSYFAWNNMKSVIERIAKKVTTAAS